MVILLTRTLYWLVSKMLKNAIESKVSIRSNKQKRKLMRELVFHQAVERISQVVEVTHPSVEAVKDPKYKRKAGIHRE